jgi:hypothetical protein
MIQSSVHRAQAGKDEEAFAYDRMAQEGTTGKEGTAVVNTWEACVHSCAVGNPYTGESECWEDPGCSRNLAAASMGASAAARGASWADGGSS